MRKISLAIVITMLVVTSTMAAPASGEHRDGETRWGTGWDYPTSDFKYVVVAPGDWESTLQPLMDWRDRTSGFRSVFLPLEDAIDNGVGRDRPAKLKYSIADAGAAAVLLVGDSDVLPVRRVFTDILLDGNESDPLNFRWTDDYYAIGDELDWDRDVDGVYGEDGEVFDEIAKAHQDRGGRLVGRIPASTELEAERFVTKILNYEISPPPGDWFTSALLVSGLMDVPNHLDNPYTPDLDGGYELFSDNSYKSHSKLQEIIPERFERTWIYDYPQLEGGDWNRSVDTMDHDSVVSAFDTGHSMVAMNGHGYIDGSGLAHYNGSGYSNYWWDWQGAYDYADADNASNGGMLPWVYVAACYVGDVTVADDKTLERLVMNPGGGAVGLVAGNGENYKGESMANASYGNWFLERTFWSYYLKYGPGFAFLNTKRDYLALIASDDVPHTPLYDSYYVADYLSPNLLGDPLTKVWTDVPGTLKVSSFTDDEVLGEAVSLTVVNGNDDPVENALVYIGWDGNNTFGWTGYDGTIDLFVPLDAGDLEVVVSAKDHLPATTMIPRPVNEPDLAVSGVTWLSEGGVEGRPILNGEEVTLRVSIDVHGRYDFDQARVRFSVAPEGGDFERLVPDVFGAIMTGEHPVVETTWLPPWPGRWQVRAEVNPAAELPDRTIMNNFGETTLSVQGQPLWATLPSSISISCGDAPGRDYDLLVHVADPDTPPDGLIVTAEAVGDVPEGLVYSVSEDGRLVVCSSLPRASLWLDLTVSDGTYTDTAQLQVDVDRTSPRLRIAGGSMHTALQGDTITGSLSIENLGPGTPEADLVMMDLSGNLLFSITPEGEYSFDASVPGTYQVRVGIQRVDGTSEANWEDTFVSFQVRPDAGWPPQPYGWPELEVVAGEEVTVHLQAVDLEGGTVTYELVDGDGLDATIDPVTGMLTLRPTQVEAGKHQVVVSLTDGSSTDDYVLQVYVTDEPASSTTLWLVLGLIVSLIVVVAIYLFLRSRRGEE
jgi:hypothetical protein